MALYVCVTVWKIFKWIVTCAQWTLFYDNFSILGTCLLFHADLGKDLFLLLKDRKSFPVENSNRDIYTKPLTLFRMSRQIIGWQSGKVPLFDRLGGFSCIHRKRIKVQDGEARNIFNQPVKFTDFFILTSRALLNWSYMVPFTTAIPLFLDVFYIYRLA